MTIESEIKKLLENAEPTADTTVEQVSEDVTVETPVVAETASEEITVDVSEDVNALVEGEDLSEEFKTKAATIFEAAVVSRVKQEVAKLQEAFDTKVEEAVESKLEGIVEHVDGYLDYIVEQWMNDNELALESGIKADIAENFMRGLKNLFQESYIEVPDDKVDVVAEMAEQIESLEAKLQESVEASSKVQAELNAIHKTSIISEISEGLSEVDADKLKSLAEELSYEDVDSFKAKIQTIRESYFKKATKPVIAGVVEEEVTDIAEEATPKVHLDESIQRYVNVLDKQK